MVVIMVSGQPIRIEVRLDPDLLLSGVVRQAGRRPAVDLVPVGRIRVGKELGQAAERGREFFYAFLGARHAGRPLAGPLPFHGRTVLITGSIHGEPFSRPFVAFIGGSLRLQLLIKSYI